MTWRDLVVLTNRWARIPGTATGEAVAGHQVWPVADQLLAEIADRLGIANWQRMGKSSVPQPKRIPRPWEKPKSKKLGSGAIPLSGFRAWWDSKKVKKS